MVQVEVDKLERHGDLADVAADHLHQAEAVPFAGRGVEVQRPNAFSVRSVGRGIFAEQASVHVEKAHFYKIVLTVREADNHPVGAVGHDG
jgi:hypothetical protein